MALPPYRYPDDYDHDAPTTIAVMVAAPGQAIDPAPPKNLQDAFDAVFVVAADQADEVVRRLTKARITHWECSPVYEYK